LYLTLSMVGPSGIIVGVPVRAGKGT